MDSIVDYETGYPPFSLCSADYNYLLAESAINIDPISDWDWQCSYNWFLSYPAYNDKSIGRILTDTNSGTVGIRAYNACGWSGWQNFSYDVYSCGYMMSISPNPSSSELNINIENSEQSIHERSTKEEDVIVFDVKLYDDNKNIVFKSQDVKSPYTLNG